MWMVETILFPAALKCITSDDYRQIEETYLVTYTVTKGWLFVSDVCTGKQFLVDSEAKNFGITTKFWATNFIKRHSNRNRWYTNGSKTLHLNISLLRIFSWRFEMAEVTFPIIGTKFSNITVYFLTCKININLTLA